MIRRLICRFRGCITRHVTVYQDDHGVVMRFVCSRCGKEYVYGVRGNPEADREVAELERLVRL